MGCLWARPPSQAAEGGARKPKETDVYSSRGALCHALNAGHTVLVDAQWFVDQHKSGGILLRRQDMEKDFDASLVKSLRPGDIWEMRLDSRGWIDMHAGGTWLLVAISYPWLSDEHPDPSGSHLKELAHFMGKLVEELGQHGKRAAVFLDYASLHQDERTDCQRKLFKKGLRHVNMWYGHRSVQVWALTHMSSARPYHDRGWTTFEWRLALLASFLVFDLGRVRDRDAALLRCLYDKFFVLEALECARVAAEPLLTPAEFDAVVERKAFRSGDADRPLVQKKYRETVEAVLGAARELDFSAAGWSVQEVNSFAAGIAPMCGQLESLILNDCPGVTDAAVGMLAERCRNLHRLCLGGCTGVTDVAVGKLAENCRDLQGLVLNHCTGVTDAAVVKLAQNCSKLQELGLSHCPGVTDDAVCRVAEGCRNLHRLELTGCTGVTDRALDKVAENCLHLEALYLSGCTGVTDAALGKVAGYCPHLQRLYLEDCAGVTDSAIAIFRFQRPGCIVWR